MAKTLHMERVGNRLAPRDPWSEELLYEIKEGAQLKVEIKSDRSHGLTNHWWAGLAYAVKNFDDELARKYPTSRHLHKAFLTQMGYVEPIYRIDGGISFEVDSVRFEAMDEATFRDMFEKARLLAIGWLGYDCWQYWADMKTAEKRDGGRG